MIVETGEEQEIVNWATFQAARSTLGASFVKILGYFREDGARSLDSIEGAMRDHDAARLVIPAHTLKGEAYQFGAERLAALAEEIEVHARHFVEIKQEPDEILPLVVALRPLFDATLSALQREMSPLVERRPGFGRRNDLPSSGFGRI